MSKLTKIIIGVAWPIPSLIIWFFAWIYTDHTLKFSTSSTILFYIYVLWYFTIVFCAFTFLLSPYFLIFKNKVFRLILILVLLILLFSTFKSSRLSHFIPPIPIYPNAYDIKYEYLKSGGGEGSPNYVKVSFAVSGSSAIQERKKIAVFYKRIFQNRGLEFRNYVSYPDYSDCDEYIEHQASQKRSSDYMSCEVRKINDSSSWLNLILSFEKDRISLVGIH